jgi:GT2 family glycosyltransferase
VNISVIIPTYRRIEKLAACVAALARQTIPGEHYEVLVGTDGPDEGAAAAARRAWEIGGGRHGGLTVLECVKAGPGPTRNRLLERAKAPTVLLLNDDVVPQHNLLEAHVRAHAELGGRPAMVLGAAPWKVHAPDRLFDRLVRETSMVFFYDQMTGPRALERGRDWGFRHAWTLNLSLPASAARGVDGFNESLRCACFEDLEFAWRLSKLGVPVLYRPEAVVQHDHRYEPLGYLAREELLGGEAYRLAAAAPECAADVFGRDVAGEAEVEYSRAFVEREQKTVERLEKSFVGLADVPSGEVAGEHADMLVRMLYEHHLPLKRWRWRKGLVAGAEAAVLRA